MWVRWVLLQGKYQIRTQKCEPLDFRNGTFCFFFFFNINQLRCYFQGEAWHFFKNLLLEAWKGFSWHGEVIPGLDFLMASTWTQLEFFKLIRLKTHFLPLLRIMHCNFFFLKQTNLQQRQKSLEPSWDVLLWFALGNENSAYTAIKYENEYVSKAITSYLITYHLSSFGRSL